MNSNHPPNTPNGECQRPDCEHWVVRFEGQPTGPTAGECHDHRRAINNTDHHARHPWPAHIEIQGGHGWASAQGYHNEWFFEAFIPGPPPSFLRATGPSLREAEDAAWRAWQAQLNCPTAPNHGPFEARSYTNGSGWCTHCGYWFNQVLPPQPTTDPDTNIKHLAQATMHLIDARRHRQPPH